MGKVAQFDALWMFSRHSDVAPICILRGGAITIDSASIENPSDAGTGKPMPRVAVQWRGQWGEFSAAAHSADVRRNGISSSQGVLVEGDTFEVGNVFFDVAYKSVTLMPPESVAALDSSPHQDRDTRSAHPDGPTVEQVVEPLVDPSLCEDGTRVTGGDASELVEPVAFEYEASASAMGAVNDEPPASVASDAVTSAADHLEGLLPGNDLIGALYRLAPHNAAWLLEVDGASWQCISLPFRITTDDAAWMLAVQASWPKNNYLIVFSDASADQIFEAISTFQTTQAESKSSSESLAMGWDAAATSSSLLTCMQGLMLVEGAASRWKFFGALDRLTAVSKELQSWK